MYHLWGHTISAHQRGHSTSGEHGTGTSDLWGHTNYRSAPPKGTFHFWGYTIYGGIPHRPWESTTYGDIPIPFKTSHLWGHSTYRDILALGTSFLRGHSTSGDISSMGTRHLWGNTTTYLWGHLTYGNIPLVVTPWKIR